MSERVLRIVNVAAAALVLAGAAAILLPRHGPTLGRVLVVAVAAAAALHAFVASSPPAWWPSPFDRGMEDDGERERPDELAWVRDRMSGRRQRIAHGPALPPDTLRLLKPLVEVALEREGLDLNEGTHRRLARTRLSPLVWSILTADPLARLRWFRTVRSDEEEVAGVVHAVLDELEDLTDGGTIPRARPEPTHHGTT